MENLVIMHDRQAVTTSLQIAKTFQKNHRDVLRVIDTLKKDVRNFAQMFSESSIPDSYGRPRRIYYLNRDGFSLLAMGFTGTKALQFKLAYIDAFNEMRVFISRQTMGSAKACRSTAVLPALMRSRCLIQLS